MPTTFHNCRLPEQLFLSLFSNFMLPQTTETNHHRKVRPPGSISSKVDLVFRFIQGDFSNGGFALKFHGILALKALDHPFGTAEKFYLLPPSNEFLIVRFLPRSALFPYL